jgi:glucosamine--fructose-6-phosphate aminotransferase (isomerizing)
MTQSKAPGAFLLETLESQPDELTRLLADDSAAAAAERLRDATRIFLVGTGTSFHGAVVGQFMLRRAGRDAWAVRAFEFAAYPPALREGDALVLFSHRGSKRFSRDSLELFKRFGDRFVAITGEGTKLEGDGLVKTVEQERSPVHTASHTAAMLRLAQIATMIGSPPWASQLSDLPRAVSEALKARREVAQAVAAIDLATTIHFAGGGPAYATALEGALKVREAAHRVQAEGHELESLLHGPLVSIQPEHSVVLVAQPGPALDRTQEVAEALVEIGTPVLAVGAAAERLPARFKVPTPLLDEVLAPIVNVIPLQWLAYEASRRLGVDADSFRRDEPTYAAAQAKFNL